MWRISLKKFVPPFEVKVQSSPILRRLYLSFFVLIFLSCWLNELAFSFQLVLSLITLAIALCFFHLNSLNGCKKITIRCRSDGSWSICQSGLIKENCRLRGTSALIGPLYFLHFESNKKRINVLLANDSMTGEEARKLRMALRVYKSQLMQP
ncbi:MAG: protein YgfX [Cycloclasticus sp.]